jgi:hypothetical protein
MAVATATFTAAQVTIETILQQERIENAARKQQDLTKTFT